MKKNIALLFILSANLVFLAHVLVPHHHHKSEIFVINGEFESDCNSDSHTAAEHNHEQEEDGNTNYCAVTKLFVIPQKHVNLDLELLKISNIDLLSNFVLAIFIDEISFNQIVNNYATTRPPYLKNKFIHFIPLTKGMRAPPKV